jgi:ADP-dependent NAD(P)H-hydrate dehydratase / NAD(P)H-hydrate epimerase
MPRPIPSHPVLSLEQARAFEAALFGGDEAREWAAMGLAGKAVADAVLSDLSEAGGFPQGGRLLVLAGKGNNAGDALVAARALLGRFPQAAGGGRFRVWPEAPEAARRAGLARAFAGMPGAGGRGGCRPPSGVVRPVPWGHFWIPVPAAPPPRGDCGHCRGGPLQHPHAGCRRPAERPRGGRGLPRGLHLCHGSVKAPSVGCPNSGRLRYLDLGFFRNAAGGEPGGDRVVLPSVLSGLAGLRPASSDKRSLGHVAIVGGSAGYPGAVLMATLAALRSGAGLVTAFVPERLSAVFASRAPEAMWVGLPETGAGELARSGLERILKGAARATAIAIGPGLGRNPETHSLVMGLVEAAAVPLVLDADALQPDVVRAGTAPRILTPHAGELERISLGQDLEGLCRTLPAVTISKGPTTRICGGEGAYLSLHGGPVLSRGGSGDLLAGLAGGLLAQTPAEPLLAACRASVWHGMAADLLARDRGQAAVRVTQLLDFLAPALRESATCPSS